MSIALRELPLGMEDEYRKSSVLPETINLKELSRVCSCNTEILSAGPRMKGNEDYSSGDKNPVDQYKKRVFDKALEKTYLDAYRTKVFNTIQKAFAFEAYLKLTPSNNKSFSAYVSRCSLSKLEEKLKRLSSGQNCNSSVFKKRFETLFSETSVEKAIEKIRGVSNEMRAPSDSKDSCLPFSSYLSQYALFNTPILEYPLENQSQGSKEEYKYISSNYKNLKDGTLVYSNSSPELAFRDAFLEQPEGWGHYSQVPRSEQPHFLKRALGYQLDNFQQLNMISSNYSKFEGNAPIYNYILSNPERMKELDDKFIRSFCHMVGCEGLSFTQRLAKFVKEDTSFRVARALFSEKNMIVFGEDLQADCKAIIGYEDQVIDNRGDLFSEPPSLSSPSLDTLLCSEELPMPSLNTLRGKLMANISSMDHKTTLGFDAIVDYAKSGLCQKEGDGYSLKTATNKIEDDFSVVNSLPSYLEHRFLHGDAEAKDTLELSSKILRDEDSYLAENQKECAALKEQQLASVPMPPDSVNTDRNRPTSEVSGDEHPLPVIEYKPEDANFVATLPTVINVPESQYTEERTAQISRSHEGEPVPIDEIDSSFAMQEDGPTMEFLPIHGTTGQRVAQVEESMARMRAEADLCSVSSEDKCSPSQTEVDSIVVAERENGGNGGVTDYFINSTPEDVSAQERYLASLDMNGSATKDYPPFVRKRRTIRLPDESRSEDEIIRIAQPALIPPADIDEVEESDGAFASLIPTSSSKRTISEAQDDSKDSSRPNTATGRSIASIREDSTISQSFSDQKHTPENITEVREQKLAAELDRHRDDYNKLANSKPSKKEDELSNTLAELKSKLRSEFKRVKSLNDQLRSAGDALESSNRQKIAHAEKLTNDDSLANANVTGNQSNFASENRGQRSTSNSSNSVNPFSSNLNSYNGRTQAQRDRIKELESLKHDLIDEKVEQMIANTKAENTSGLGGGKSSSKDGNSAKGGNSLASKFGTTSKGGASAHGSKKGGRIDGRSPASIVDEVGGITDAEAGSYVEDRVIPHFFITQILNGDIRKVVHSLGLYGKTFFTIEQIDDDFYMVRKYVVDYDLGTEGLNEEFYERFRISLLKKVKKFIADKNVNELLEVADHVILADEQTMTEEEAGPFLANLIDREEMIERVRNMP